MTVASRLDLLSTPPKLDPVIPLLQYFPILKSISHHARSLQQQSHTLFLTSHTSPSIPLTPSEPAAPPEALKEAEELLEASMVLALRFCKVTLILLPQLPSFRKRVHGAALRQFGKAAAIFLEQIQRYCRTGAHDFWLTLCGPSLLGDGGDGGDDGPRQTAEVPGSEEESSWGKSLPESQTDEEPLKDMDSANPGDNASWAEARSGDQVMRGTNHELDGPEPEIDTALASSIPNKQGTKELVSELDILGPEDDKNWTKTQFKGNLVEEIQREETAPDEEVDSMEKQSVVLYAEQTQQELGDPNPEEAASWTEALLEDQTVEEIQKDMEGPEPRDRGTKTRVEDQAVEEPEKDLYDPEPEIDSSRTKSLPDEQDIVETIQEPSDSEDANGTSAGTGDPDKSEAQQDSGDSELKDNANWTKPQHDDDDDEEDLVGREDAGPISGLDTQYRSYAEESSEDHSESHASASTTSLHIASGTAFMHASTTAPSRPASPPHFPTSGIWGLPVVRRQLQPFEDMDETAHLIARKEFTILNMPLPRYEPIIPAADLILPRQEMSFLSTTCSLGRSRERHNADSLSIPPIIVTAPTPSNSALSRSSLSSLSSTPSTASTTSLTHQITTFAVTSTPLETEPTVVRPRATAVIATNTRNVGSKSDGNKGSNSKAMGRIDRPKPNVQNLIQQFSKGPEPDIVATEVEEVEENEGKAPLPRQTQPQTRRQKEKQRSLEDGPEVISVPARQQRANVATTGQFDNDSSSSSSAALPVKSTAFVRTGVSHKTTKEHDAQQLQQYRDSPASTSTSTSTSTSSLKYSTQNHSNWSSSKESRLSWSSSLSFSSQSSTPSSLSRARWNAEARAYADMEQLIERLREQNRNAEADEVLGRVTARTESSIRRIFGPIHSMATSRAGSEWISGEDAHIHKSNGEGSSSACNYNSCTSASIKDDRARGSSGSKDESSVTDNRSSGAENCSNDSGGSKYDNGNSNNDASNEDNGLSTPESSSRYIHGASTLHLNTSAQTQVNQSSETEIIKNAGFTKKFIKNDEGDFKPSRQTREFLVYGLPRGSSTGGPNRSSSRNSAGPRQGDKVMSIVNRFNESQSLASPAISRNGYYSVASAIPSATTPTAYSQSRESLEEGSSSQSPSSSVSSDYSLSRRSSYRGQMPSPNSVRAKAAALEAIKEQSSRAPSAPRTQVLRSRKEDRKQESSNAKANDNEENNANFVELIRVPTQSSAWSSRLGRGNSSSSRRTNSTVPRTTVKDKEFGNRSWSGSGSDYDDNEPLQYLDVDAKYEPKAWLEHDSAVEVAVEDWGRPTSPINRFLRSLSTTYYSANDNDRSYSEGWNASESSSAYSGMQSRRDYPQTPEPICIPTQDVGIRNSRSSILPLLSIRNGAVTNSTTSPSPENQQLVSRVSRASEYVLYSSRIHQEFSPASTTSTSSLPQPIHSSTSTSARSTTSLGHRSLPFSGRIESPASRGACTPPTAPSVSTTSTSTVATARRIYSRETGVLGASGTPILGSSTTPLSVRNAAALLLAFSSSSLNSLNSSPSSS